MQLPVNGAEPGSLGGLRNPLFDPTSIEAAIRLLTGKPELVVVDARVLRILMGDLAGLIILGDAMRFQPVGPQLPPGEERFAWEDEPPCG